jgi:hypothetical protein
MASKPRGKSAKVRKTRRPKPARSRTKRPQPSRPITGAELTATGNPRDYGYFEDHVHACWLEDGRDMALLKPLIFHQMKGNRTWTAPQGTLTDGASIPPAFWSVIGGPFEGKYRDAAVNHDYECCSKRNAWRDVHRMFYDGMMARGVEFWRAKLMYWAVYCFGPRWPETEARVRRDFREGDIARAAELFRSRPDITLEEIEELTPARLRSRVPRVPQHIEGAACLDVDRKIPVETRDEPCTTSECG